MDSTVKTLIGLGGTAIAAYAVWEFLRGQCAVNGGTFSGNLASTGLCKLFDSVAGQTGPSIDPKYLDPTVLGQFVAAGRAAGLTDAAIQSKLDELITEYNACTPPATWQTGNGSCIGGTVTALPPEVLPTPVFTSPAPIPTPVNISPALAPIPIMWPAGYPQAIQEMKMRAGNDLENFDQWAWFWGTGTAGSTMPALYGTMLTTGLMQAVINAGGGNRAALISAEQFVAWLQQAFAAAGLSGLGILNGGGIPVPAWMIHGGSGRYA